MGALALALQEKRPGEQGAYSGLPPGDLHPVNAPGAVPADSDYAMTLIRRIAGHRGCFEKTLLLQLHTLSLHTAGRLWLRHKGIMSSNVYSLKGLSMERRLVEPACT